MAWALGLAFHDDYASAGRKQILHCLITGKSLWKRHVGIAFSREGLVGMDYTFYVFPELRLNNTLTVSLGET
jgi:hypothetical protein